MVLSAVREGVYGTGILTNHTFVFGTKSISCWSTEPPHLCVGTRSTCYKSTDTFVLLVIGICDTGILNDEFI